MTRTRRRSAPLLLTLDDFRPAAERRLPRALASYVASAAGDGAVMEANRRAFSRWCFVSRVLRDTRARSARVSLLGREYAMPVGISALGASAVLAFDADIAMAQAARDANVPYQLSANAITPLEAVIAVNPDAWFAAYLPADRGRIDAVLDRVSGAGFSTLVVTVDVPTAAVREAEIRAGYAMPFRISRRLLADIAFSPRWVAGTALRTVAKRGLPRIQNLDASAGPHVLSPVVGQVGGTDRLSWDDMRHIRRRWSGRLVVKGILSAEDARLARDGGIDGVIVSNHGGRVSDSMIPALDALPEIRAACPDMSIMLDGGVRRGGDVLKAVALGADAAFVGRPFAYAAVTGGRRDIAHALDLLARDLHREMAFLGLLDMAETRSGRLRRRDAAG